MAKFDPEREAHKAWLGLVQPVGLVVSPPALIKALAVLDKNIIEIQQALLRVVIRPASGGDDADPVLLDFPRFATEVLGWSLSDLAGASGGPHISDTLAVALPDYGETLRPTYAVLDGIAAGKELLLVQLVERGISLDKPPSEDVRTGWPASPQARLERLLRDTKVPAGLLCNGEELRLVYAPSGESSGHVGFPIAAMCTVGGRLILGALHMLLSEHRVFGAPDGQRLLDILAESRKYQSEVSTKLSEQVLGALWQLLRGLQAADEAANGRVLYDLEHTTPDQIYGGTLTVIMRMVFLLYAEDQGMMPDDPIYARNYSITGLYERLRQDAGRYPDTMDQRYGAWSWLLSTFRLVFDGGSHAGLSLPARHGQLFNPDEYPFLEGRAPGVLRGRDTFDAPRVADGVIWRVLEGLLVLEGERLSYRALDVEQIGSVYEAMMGFDVRTTAGRSIAVKPKRVVVDLDELLKQPAGKRADWLKTEAECEPTGKSAEALKAAKCVDDLVAALGRRVAQQTPHALPPGALFLQPGEERRRSGSHYTPRELTEPIVRTTLRPVLAALGERPTPEQILNLKVCDPAMGSGAFLVEACRQLADALVAAWEVHRCTPAIPPDEVLERHARRVVAQRCLYGVDKNPFAVNLAKLSLWLVTLARDHAFTFLDHALKHGDSLVGLTQKQIGAFHWNPPDQGWEDLPLLKNVSLSITKADSWRQRIQLLDEGAYDDRREAWREAEEELKDARFIGDLCVAAFFGADNDKARERLRVSYSLRLDEWRAGRMGLSELREVVEELHGGERPVVPFHWEIEFPEVFGPRNPGFDAFFGNPPFLGGRRISTVHGPAYLGFLQSVHPEARNLCDLVAHFVRRSYGLIREKGTLGQIVTNTISQGDTRSGGLAHICLNLGGTIFEARRRYKWPGASVVVSVIHIKREPVCGDCRLDGVVVPRITAYLFHLGGSRDPARLAGRNALFSSGSQIYGQGFLFADDDDGASSLADLEELRRTSPREASRVHPYLGGSELNQSPTHSPHRCVIYLSDLREEKELDAWPLLASIVREKVKPERDRLPAGASNTPLKRRWWAYQAHRPQLYASMVGMSRVLVCSKVAPFYTFAFLPTDIIFSQKLNVLLFDDHGHYALLQSQLHDEWARFFSSTSMTLPNYVPSDCFETFPFADSAAITALVDVGKVHYDFRAALMSKNNEGLTDTYNRFHDPNERSPDILGLRELHAAMDRAVLDAYGWNDIPTNCDFFLDYEIDEETWGKKKKPYRYRWPDEVHDEVLARLLELNQKRYDEEVAAGLHGKPAAATASASKKRTAKASRKSPGASRKPKAPPTNAMLSLFDRKGEEKS